MEAAQEFTFRNKTLTHSNNKVLYEKIYGYFLAGKFTDVSITNIEEKREFKCHRLVLAAACEHFETMFTNDWREKYEKTLDFSDVDGEALELLLQFAYRGVIVLGEKNIFAALRLSHRFGMRTLEDLCVRYLIERDIPMNCAIELFVFVCAVYNTALIPRLSQFILDHLPEFPKDNSENGLLRIRDLADLKTLLTNRQPMSLKQEEELWAALLYWTSEMYPRQGSVLSELAPFCRFHFFRPPDILIRWVCDAEDRALTFKPYPDPGPVEIKSAESLYMYVKSDANAFDLLKMDACRDDAINFHRITHEKIISNECKMKTVTVGNQLYIYALLPREYDYELIFSVYSSVSLADELGLKRPGNLWQFRITKGVGATAAFNAASTSGDSIHQRIYLLYSIASVFRKALFEYDCGSNTWLAIDYKRSIETEAEIITYFNHRLYLFGRNRIVRAADPRVGRWESVPNSGLLHCHLDKLCGHRGKLYATCWMERVHKFGSSHVKSEVYDPVAGRWRDVSPTLFPAHPIPSARWLLSYENKLWLFGRKCPMPPPSSDFNYSFQTFDSFSQTWDECRYVFRSPGEGGTIRDILVSRYG